MIEVGLVARAAARCVVSAVLLSPAAHVDAAPTRASFESLLEPRPFARLSSGGRMVARLLNGEEIAPRRGAAERPLTKRAAPGPRAGRRVLRGVLGSGDNVRVNDPDLDGFLHTQSETSVAVSGRNVVVSFNDLGGLDAFEPAGELSTSGYSISTDGGRTFVHDRIPALRGGQDVGDGVVAAGIDGRFHYSTLAVAFVSAAARESVVVVATSTDGGMTFSPPVIASGPPPEPAAIQDKSWLATDTWSTSPHRGAVYVSWTVFHPVSISRPYRSEIRVARSTDGGKTFGAPAIVSPSEEDGDVQGSVPSVFPNGDVVVTYFDGRRSALRIARSTDGGRTFDAPHTVAAATFVDYVTGGDLVRANSFPSVTTDRSGNLHVVYAARPAPERHDRSDVFYTRSTDGGATFSAPVRLGDDATSTAQFFPAIAAAPDGTLGVKWYDRRNDPLHDGLTDVYMTLSHDGGEHFGSSFRITDQNWVFGPVEAGAAASYHGDYDGLAADEKGFYLAWSDERGSDPDVYFTTIPLTRDPGQADFNVSVESAYLAVAAGRSVDVALSTSAAGSFQGQVALEVQGGPPGISYRFSYPAVTAGDRVALTISTDAAVPPGTYLLSVRATATGLARASTLRLNVYPADRVGTIPLDVTDSRGLKLLLAGPKLDVRGIAHVVYRDEGSGEAGLARGAVFYGRLAPGDTAINKAVQLLPAGAVSGAWSLDLDAAGRIYVAWSALGPGAPLIDELDITTSIDDGKSFSPPVRLEQTGAYLSRSSAAAYGDGTVALAFITSAGQGEPAVLRATTSTDGGRTFSQPVAVAPPGGTVAELDLRFDRRGNAYLLYAYFAKRDGNDFTDSSLRLAIAPQGRFGSALTFPASNDPLALLPQLAIDASGTLYVGYARAKESGGFDIRVIASRDDGLSFSEATEIAEVSSPLFSVAAGDRGYVAVTWVEEDGSGNRDIQTAVSFDGAKTFGAKVSLSRDPGDSFFLARSTTIKAGGLLLVGWMDDSSGTLDIHFGFLRPPGSASGGDANAPPLASIAVPSPGRAVDAGEAVDFEAVARDPDVSHGDVLSYRWSFDDGSTADGPHAVHAFGVPGTHTIVLTVTDLSGASSSASVQIVVRSPDPSAGAGTDLFLPLVERVPAPPPFGGFETRTELTLSSRAEIPVKVLLEYHGSETLAGYASIVLAARETRVFADAVELMRERGTPIPAASAARGFLRLRFVGAPAEQVFVTARRIGPRAGTAVPATPPLTSAGVIVGLLRSSLETPIELVDLGDTGVTLRVEVFGPAGEVVSPPRELVLAPHQRVESTIPALTSASVESDRVVVTRVSGSAPFAAFALVPQLVDSTGDDTYLPALAPSGSPVSRLLLPVVLRLPGGRGNRYFTEATFANATSRTMPLTLRYTATRGSGSGVVSLTLLPFEQRFVPYLVDFLAANGLAIPRDSGAVGTLLVEAPAGTKKSDLAVSVNVLSAAPLDPGGIAGEEEHTVTFRAIPFDEAADATGWVFGLQQSSLLRSKVAVVNWGDAGDPITLRVTYCGSLTGIGSCEPIGAPLVRTLAPGVWFQAEEPLFELHARTGFAKIERLAGASRFSAYGVLNDNDAGSDPTYLPMVR